MANHISDTPVKGGYDAYPICFDEAAQSHFRFVPLDYPNGSQKCRLMLVVWEHDSNTKLNLKKSSESRFVKRAKEWLQERGVPSVEKIRLVDAEDPAWV